MRAVLGTNPAIAQVHYGTLAHRRYRGWYRRTRSDGVSASRQQDRARGAPAASRPRSTHDSRDHGAAGVGRVFRAGQGRDGARLADPVGQCGRAAGARRHAAAREDQAPQVRAARELTLIELVFAAGRCFLMGYEYAGLCATCVQYCRPALLYAAVLTET